MLQGRWLVVSALALALSLGLWRPRLFSAPGLACLRSLPPSLYAMPLALSPALVLSIRMALPVAHQINAEPEAPGVTAELLGTALARHGGVHLRSAGGDGGPGDGRTRWGSVSAGRRRIAQNGDDHRRQRLIMKAGPAQDGVSQKPPRGGGGMVWYGMPYGIE